MSHNIKNIVFDLGGVLIEFNPFKYLNKLVFDQETCELFVKLVFYSKEWDEYNKSKYDLFYIQAWLNHPYTEKLFQIMGSDFEGGFTARGTYLLKKIPFVELDFEDNRQKRLYEDVVNASRRVYDLNEVLETKKNKAALEVIQREKENIIKEIEKNITRIYKLQF